MCFRYRYVGRNFSVLFFSSGREKKNDVGNKRSNHAGLFYIFPPWFSILVCVTQISVTDPVFFPHDGKKTGECHSGEVRRRSYVITSKRKRLPLSSSPVRLVVSHTVALFWVVPVRVQHQNSAGRTVASPWAIPVRVQWWKIFQFHCHITLAGPPWDLLWPSSVAPHGWFPFEFKIKTPRLNEYSIRTLFLGVWWPHTVASSWVIPVRVQIQTTRDVLSSPHGWFPWESENKTPRVE